MEMRRDEMVCQRIGVSIALVLCMIVVSFIGSHGKPFDVDEKKVESLWRSCDFIPSKIKKQLHSSDVSPEEIDLALRNCLTDQSNPPIYIPISHQTKHLPSPYSNEVIALRRQLAARRKARASAHENRRTISLAPTPSPTKSSSIPSPAPVHSPSDAPTIAPSAPIPAPAPASASVPAPASVPDPASVPAPSPASDILLPITTFPPPPKPTYHAQVKKSQKALNDKPLLIKAVAFSVLGTSLVAFILFCCYRWKKKREFHAYSQSRPLLSLTLSDFSGSSHTSNCSSPIDVSRLGTLKSDFGHHQNVIHHNVSQPGFMTSLKVTNVTGNTVPLETVVAKMTELTPFHAPNNGPPSAPPPPPPPLPQKTPPGPPPPSPPGGPRLPSGNKPGPPPLPAGRGSGPSPPPPLGGNKPGAPRPPGPPVPSKGRPSALKTEPSTTCNAEGQKPKLKPFFWDKVSANPEQAVVWNQIKSGSFQFSEEMIENLFGYQASEKSKAAGVKGAGQSDQPSLCVRLLESKKSQNLAISLKALNVKIEDVLAAVNEGNELPSELVETLLKMWPTTQEENRLLLYSEDLAMLGPAEQFLIELIKIDHVYDRLDCLYFMSSLQEELTTCKQAFSTLEVACTELKDCRLFKKILEAVIKIGNFINKDTNRGGAVAIKLDNLLKLRDLKAKDGKTTLLHVVMQEIIRSEGKRLASQNPSPIGESDNDYYEDLGLKVISAIGNELENVKKSAGLDMDIITNTVEHLGKKLDVIKRVLETKIMKIKGDSGFRDVLEYFVNQAEGEVKFLSHEKKRVWDLVEDTAKSFYPSTKKDEGLRLFVVVRDFLWMWDRACKDVKDAAAAASRTSRQRRAGSLGEGSGSSPGLNVPDPRQHLFQAIKNKRVDDSGSDEDG